MDEKRYYDEKEETKQIPLVCAVCRQENTYPVRYIVRTKKAQIPQAGTKKTALNSPKRVLTWCAWTIWSPAGIFAAARDSNSPVKVFF